MITYFLITCAIALTIIVGFVILAVAIWLLVVKLSIAFSRVAMSLLIAALTVSNFVVVDNQFLNFLLLSAIIYAIIRLISLFPRVDLAIVATCALTVGSVISLFSASVIFSLFSKTINNSWIIAITVVVGLAILSFVYYIEIQKVKLYPRKLTFLSNKFFVRIGRVVASLVYGFVFLIVLSFILGAMMPHSTLVQIVMLVALSVAAYIADLFLFDRAG